jgi:hypothetical protein
VDGLAVLLDVRAGEYIVLDPVATEMWQVLLSAEAEKRVAKLQQQFEVPEDRLKVDLAEFARSCIERGFLREEPAPATVRERQPRARRGLLVLRAWWSLLSTAHALTARGFADTYLRYSHLPKPAAVGESWKRVFGRAERAFARAEHFFVMRSAPQDCLPRSLALYRFLLSAGIPADHCIGVRRHPFRAHAWVEYDHRVLCDSTDFVRRYVELARI